MTPDQQIIIAGYSIVGIVILLLILFYILTRKSGGSQWRKQVTAKLVLLDKLASSGDLYQLKSAVIEADKLLDYVFRSKGIKGETMGERLKNAKKQFEWNEYQNIWEAHKLRNKMAHEIEFNPNTKELKEKYTYLRKAIKSL